SATRMRRRRAGAARHSASRAKADIAINAMPSLPDLAKLKPAGGKRSSKREQIVNVFLRQEGHLSADDLVDLIRSEDHRISRATVYRTLQWMTDACIARKVDFGEGRFRFE